MTDETEIGLPHAVVVQERGAGAGERDAAVLQHVSLAGELERDRHVLLDQHAGEPVAVQVTHGLQDALHDGGRQAQRGLVEHDELGRAHQTAADGEHLLLAARQRAGGLRAALGQHREQRIDPLQIARAVGAGARQHGAHPQVLGDRERGENLAPFRHLAEAKLADLVARPAGNVLPAIEDTAARGLEHAGDGADERGLAGAVGADDGRDRALLDCERDAVERLGVAVEDVEVFDRQHYSTASAPR